MRYLFINLIVSLFILTSCHEGFQHLQEEENIYNLTTEEQLDDETYALEIENFYNKGKEGFFTGKADVKIYYKIFKQPESASSAILISSGRTEAAIKYKELIFDLYNNGYSIYIHDHRGQGLSGRMTADHDMGYIDDFQYYVDDMKLFYDSLLHTANHKNKYLLCHSMGGAIGMTYLEQNAHDFNAAAFSSPMLGLPTGTCTGAKLLEKDNPTYGLGEGKYNDDAHVFEKNTLTGSEIRYNRMNQAFDQVPEARLGGASYHWVVKSCEQFDYMNQHIDKIETPFILFSAENEQIVSLKAHRVFIEQAKEQDKTFEAFLIENAQHELLMEKDVQRIETVNRFLSFFEKFN